MAYGLNPRLFIENGPAIRAAEAHARSSSTAFRTWSHLDAKGRLQLIEMALDHANDSDELPLAL
jgi:hypothetical protein